MKIRNNTILRSSRLRLIPRAVTRDLRTIIRVKFNSLYTQLESRCNLRTKSSEIDVVSYVDFSGLTAESLGSDGKVL